MEIFAKIYHPAFFKHTCIALTQNYEKNLGANEYGGQVHASIATKIVK